MLIGIDVCHKPKKSIVGIVGTISQSMMQYSSQYIIQDKGQEIVDNLGPALEKIFQTYREHNNGENPDHIFVYRDGVGDSMRNLVLEKELPTFSKLINKLYNTARPPKLTLIIVNKRISQRFTATDPTSGKIMNPCPGTVIDTKVVNKEASSICYDFYLVPQNATQGSVTPTHFFVAFDDSGLKKNVIEQFTYNLCYAYFNWAGSIKVPAPCMYAHKIAEYVLETKKVNGRTTNTSKPTDLDKVSDVLHFL